jgi:kynureninase
MTGAERNRNSTNSLTTARRLKASVYISYMSEVKDLRHSRSSLLTDIPIRFIDS